MKSCKAVQERIEQKRLPLFSFLYNYSRQIVVFHNISLVDVTQFPWEAVLL